MSEMRRELLSIAAALAAGFAIALAGDAADWSTGVVFGLVAAALLAILAVSLLRAPGGRSQQRPPGLRR